MLETSLVISIKLKISISFAQQPHPYLYSREILVQVFNIHVQNCSGVSPVEWKLHEVREPSQLPISDRKQILQQLFVQ